MEFKTITDTPADFAVGGSKTYRGPELGLNLERDLRVQCVRINTRVDVESTTAFAGGLQAGCVDAILKTLYVWLTTLAASQQKRTPYNEETYFELRRTQKRLMEMALAGETDTTTGLQKPLIVGTTQLAFSIIVPTGHIEPLLENPVLGGIGTEQLRLCELRIKCETEPLAAINAALKLKRIYTELQVGVEVGNGSRIGGVPTVVHELTNVGKSQLDTIPDGFPLFIDHETATLAANTLGKYELKVGDKVVVDDSRTAAEVYADYKAKPDVGTLEASVSSEVTPLLSTSDTALKNLVSGKAVLRLVTKGSNEWNVGAVVQEPLSAEYGWETLAAIAATRPKGRSVLAINVAPLNGLNYQPRHLSICGADVFDEDERQAWLHPGLRATSGGDIDVYIPEDMEREAARMLVAARRTEDPEKAKLMKEAAYRHVMDWVPFCAVTSRGYDQETWGLQTVRARVEAAANRLEAAEQLILAQVANAPAQPLKKR